MAGIQRPRMLSVRVLQYVQWLTEPDAMLPSDSDPHWGRTCGGGIARSLLALFAAAGLGLATACVPVEVVGHSVAVSEANALIAEARVSLSRPARVFVEYDNPLAGRYRTALGALAAEHVIPIVRLRPETTYDYTIFTLRGSDVSDAVRGPRGNFTTSELPAPLASIFTMATGRSSQPLVLADYSHPWTKGKGGKTTHFVFWDEVGALVWYARVEFAGAITRLPGQDNFVFVPDKKNRLRQLTPFGEVADLTGDVGHVHHDVVVLDGGRMLFPIRRELLYDDPANGGLRTTYWYDDLGIWHPGTGRVDQIWSAKEAWNMLDPAQHVQPVVADGLTHWTHINSVSLGPSGNIVASLRHRNQVISLSSDYQIEWQLFGPDSDYEFPNPTDRFYRQHTASQLANGNILLFDNGNGRPEAEGGEYSRALELRLDDVAGTAVKVWEYRPDPDIYAPLASSAYRLSNGNTLVNFGVSVREVPHAPLVVLEVAPSGDEMFRVETVELHRVGPNLGRSARPMRYRAYGGFEAISGETMLRSPAGWAGPSFEERLSQRYGDMTHIAAQPFDLYVGDGWLMYEKAPCEAEDIALPFLLHVLPEALEDLPDDRRGLGFDNLDFKFLERGVAWQGRCHAELQLPEYAIDHIRTGQFVAEDEAVEGPDDRERRNGSPASGVWSVKIPLAP